MIAGATVHGGTAVRRPGAFRREAFLLGTMTALCLGGGVLYLAWVFGPPGRSPALALPLLCWIEANLGTAAPVFALLAALYFATLAGLGRQLARGEGMEEVAQADHLTDLWITLFFGTGVIWTAIGMRGALLFALGEPERLGQDGAFAVLQRMVDGGILLALSTTIVGGAGGYLMRVAKAVTVGGALRRCYARGARRQGERIEHGLRRIEARLRRAGGTTAAQPAAADPGSGPWP